MDELQAFAENVWLVDGPNVRDAGFIFPTRMTIVRLSDGSLWVDSPVPVSFETLTRIAGLGPVRYLVTGTPRHVWRLALWHALFPQAQLWAPRPTLLTVQEGHLPFTGTLGDQPDHAWATDFDQLAFKGNPLGEEIVFFHRESATVILDDLITRFSPVTANLIGRGLARLLTVPYPPGGVSYDIRLTFTNRALARRSLDRLLAWDFDKLIVAHGACIEQNARAFAAQAFHWLT